METLLESFREVVAEPWLILREQDWMRLAVAELLTAMLEQFTVIDVFFEQFAVYSLGCGCAVAGGNDHLAVGRRHAARRIEPRHTRAHALIDLNLAAGVEPRA